MHKTVVDDYVEEIEMQALAMSDPETGLDPDSDWISVNALILIGCLKCSGSDKQKGDVFYRVVQPEMGNRVLCQDRDIRMAIFFLTNLATILEYMQHRITPTSIIDVEYYKTKMNNYEVVFDAVIEDFINSMFGQFSNSVSKATF